MKDSPRVTSHGNCVYIKLVLLTEVVNGFATLVWVWKEHGTICSCSHTNSACVRCSEVKGKKGKWVGVALKTKITTAVTVVCCVRHGGRCTGCKCASTRNCTWVREKLLKRQGGKTTLQITHRRALCDKHLTERCAVRIVRCWRVEIGNRLFAGGGWFLCAVTVRCRRSLFGTYCTDE